MASSSSPPSFAMEGDGRAVVTSSRREVVMRKGPWMAEEDEILMEYVRKHGPRDWSSIRSKGLLPRTGKSCRLRWVNKLKPDLKTGCKFSPEEERIVIELQAQFGNKWAKIATFLTGRTDNDVKNFWSTRQKRLARLLRTPLTSRSSHKNHQKLPAFPPDTSIDDKHFGDGSSNGQCREGSDSFMDFSDSTLQMGQMPDFVTQSLGLNVDTSLPLLESQTERKLCVSSDNTTPPELPFKQLPLPPFDLPSFLLDGQDLIPGLDGEMCFQDEFAPRTSSECSQPLNPEGLPIFGNQAGTHHGIKREDTNSGVLDGFFDELPTDMFGSLDPLPASSVW